MSDAWEGLKVVLHPGYEHDAGAGTYPHHQEVGWISHRDLISLYEVPSRVPWRVCHACDIPGSGTICVEKQCADPNTVHLFPREQGDYAEWLEMALGSIRAKKSYDELKGRLPSLIGDEIVQLDDGTFLWAPYPDQGGWLAWHLRVIASYLDDLYRKATEEAQ